MKIKRSLKEKLSKLFDELEKQLQCDCLNCPNDCEFNDYSGFDGANCTLAYVMNGLEFLEVEDE